jgi:hypothetical protein
VAAATPLFGTLGDAPIREHFDLLADKNTEAFHFGWNRRGAGGSYTLQQNYIGYFPHRPGSASGLAVFPFDGQILYGNDIPEGCALNDVMAYAHANIFCPFWFFDWCKQYLAMLRAFQPKFDAPAGAKLVWTTQVAWALNAALGATNLHGSILPSAIYEHITGSAFDNWAGDGSYMYTAQHAAVFPDYWKNAWTQAANEITAQQPGTLLLDSGYKVFDRNFGVKWESSWHGSVFAAPLETARFRYDPPISVKESNVRADKWEMKGLAGALYNNTVSNDPYVIRDSSGRFLDDKGLAILRHAMWSQFTPWTKFRTYGSHNASMARELDRDGRSLLDLSLTLSTFFSPGEGMKNDELFWSRLNNWYGSDNDKPKLLRVAMITDLQISLTKGSKLLLVPLYAPNHELSFRYYYPAMIDTVLACDFYGLINTGVNTWWKYNINSGAGVGMFKATEATPIFNPSTGAPLRDKNGVLNGAPIVPTGTVQQQHELYQKQQADSRGIAVAVNLAQSFLAILQAVIGGNYGALVSAGKNWYDAFATKFPAPTDNWKGVVPPTPLVQRRIPSFNFVKDGNSEPMRVIPNVSGWTSPHGANPVVGGGATIFDMMASVRGYIFALRRFGAPFSLTPEDRIDLEGIRNPVGTLNANAPRSLAFPEFPKPGFDPGSKEAIDTLNAAVTPSRRSKGGLTILGFGFASAVLGVLLARRRDINLRPWRRRG